MGIERSKSGRIESIQSRVSEQSSKGIKTKLEKSNKIEDLQELPDGGVIRENGKRKKVREKKREEIYKIPTRCKKVETSRYKKYGGYLIGGPR